MKIGSRASVLCCLLLVLSLLFVQGLTAHAQNANSFGLSADDCALLQAATASGKLSSFNMAYELTLNATGVNGRNVDVSIKGSGPFEYDGSTADLSAGALQKLTMQNTVSSSVATEGRTSTGNLEFRILNGTLYVEGEDLTQGKWRSIDLSQLGNAGALRNRGFGGRQVNPAALLDLVQAARQLSIIPGFIRVERTADTTLENQQIANFVYHVDLPTLFNSPNFTTFLRAVLAQTPNGSRLNEAAVRVFASRLATAFKDTTLTVTRAIGVSDKLPHGLSIDFVTKFDPRTLPPALNAGAAATPDPSAQPIRVNFHFSLTISGIDSKAAVTAPEGAIPFTSDTSGGSQPARTPEATAAQ